jgi:hypothetical protein
MKVRGAEIVLDREVSIVNSRFLPSRRFFLSLIGSIGMLSVSGSHAQENVTLVGTPYQDSMISFGGPFSTRSMTMLPVDASEQLTSQKIGSHPSRIVDQTNYPHFEAVPQNKAFEKRDFQ